MDVLLRVAEERDAEAACAVLRRSITECCSEDHGDDQGRLEPWLANKTPENVREWIGAPSNHAVVAEVDGDIVGVAMMHESGEITLCYLVPEVRFTGKGKALLAELESRARQLELGELRLHSTKTARAFYARNGFVSSGAPDLWHEMECYPMVKYLGRQ